MKRSLFTAFAFLFVSCAQQPEIAPVALSSPNGANAFSGAPTPTYQPIVTSLPTASATASPSPTVTPATTSVTYANTVGSILQTSCGSCHGTSNPRSGVTVTSCTSDASLWSRVVAQITGGLMPTSGPLSSQQQASFTAWQQGGYLCQ